MRLAILAALGLASCTAAPAIVMTAEQARAMCRADPATAIAIAERFDHLSDLDGPGIVAQVCAPGE